MKNCSYMKVLYKFYIFELRLCEIDECFLQILMQLLKSPVRNTAHYIWRSLNLSLKSYSLLCFSVIVLKLRWIPVLECCLGDSGGGRDRLCLAFVLRVLSCTSARCRMSGRRKRKKPFRYFDDASVVARHRNGGVCDSCTGLQWFVMCSHRPS